MIKFTICFFLGALFFVTACSDLKENDYEAFLKKGTLLSIGDTVTVGLKAPLFYSNSFSAGVQPIHYRLAHLNSDSTVVAYVNRDEFYIGDEGVDGGPSKEVYIFEGKKEGFVRLEFYNPYYNKEAYQNESEEHHSSNPTNLPLHKDLKTVVCYVRIKP